MVVTTKIMINITGQARSLGNAAGVLVYYSPETWLVISRSISGRL